jgi:hypothetical protein
MVQLVCHYFDFDVRKIKSVTLHQVEEELSEVRGRAVSDGKIELWISKRYIGEKQGSTEGGYVNDSQDIWEALARITAHEVYHVVQFMTKPYYAWDEVEDEKRCDENEQEFLFHFRRNRPKWAMDNRRSLYDKLLRLAARVYWKF